MLKKRGVLRKRGKQRGVEEVCAKCSKLRGIVLKC